LSGPCEPGIGGDGAALLGGPEKKNLRAGKINDARDLRGPASGKMLAVENGDWTCLPTRGLELAFGRHEVAARGSDLAVTRDLG
jgi:hypothetical protein